MTQPDTPVAAGEVRLCSVDEIEDDTPLRVEIEGHPPLAVCRSDGEFFVVDDTCSHGEASLSEGNLENGRIECPWHSGSFCLKTGQALTFPAITPIRVYPATVKDGAVFISLPDTST